MSTIVEVREDGALTLPPDVLPHRQRPARYSVDVEGDALILRPVVGERPPFWATATGEERARRFREWAESHVAGPGIPDETLRRESMYD